jgi:hypothetical protein
MGYRNSKKTRKITGVLPGVVRDMGWDVKLDMHSFFPIWEKVVSDNAASCSRPLKIVKDVLWLEVENSTWMQQLLFEKMQILDDINAALTLSRIRDIKFVLPQDDDPPMREEIGEITFIPPDPEAVKRFEKQVSVIEDDAAREALVRLWYLSKACRRTKDE